MKMHPSTEGIKRGKEPVPPTPSVNYISKQEKKNRKGEEHAGLY